jgi:hypothetical protein
MSFRHSIYSWFFQPANRRSMLQASYCTPTRVLPASYSSPTVENTAKQAERREFRTRREFRRLSQETTSRIPHAPRSTKPHDARLTDV